MVGFLDGRADWIGPVGPNTVSSPVGTLTYANNHVIATETIGQPA